MLCIIVHGKWSTTPLNHAMKFGHILDTLIYSRNFWTHVFSFLSPISHSETVFQVEIPPCDSLMHSTLPDDPKNVNEYFTSIQHGPATCQIPRECPIRFLAVFKMCQNFMAWFRGMADHLPWLIVHNIKPTDHGSYHIKGFQDCSIYNGDKWGLKINIWVE